MRLQPGRRVEEVEKNAAVWDSRQQRPRYASIILPGGRRQRGNLKIWKPAYFVEPVYREQSLGPCEACLITGNC